LTYYIPPLDCRCVDPTSLRQANVLMSNATHASSFSRRVILYVDDDANDCFIVRGLVGRMCKGLDLRFVSDGDQAVAWLSGTGIYADRNAYPLPDLLLADLRMPRFDGFQLLAWVRRQPQLQQLPVVIYSDSFMHNVEGICKELGANQFISKHTNCDAITGFFHEYVATHGLQASGG
jgi:CheY-like chemotaxis protein